MLKLQIILNSKMYDIGLTKHSDHEHSRYCLYIGSMYDCTWLLLACPVCNEIICSDKRLVHFFKQFLIRNNFTIDDLYKKYNELYHNPKVEGKVA